MIRCYSYISYWCAWIKANYPLVFFTVLFNNEGLEHYTTCMREAKDFGISIKPPDVSRSKSDAHIENIEKNTIRMGLNCIKGLGDVGANDIMNNQPYSTIQEFFKKTDKGHNKKNVESCIKIGAFESLPLVLPKQYLPDNLKECFKIVERDSDYLVYMHRRQQQLWFETVSALGESKSMPKYLVDLTTVAGKYLNQFDEGDLVTEKSQPNCVTVPEDKLDMFGKTVKELKKSRCGCKGIFKEEKEDKPKETLDKFVRAFVREREEIAKTKFNGVVSYIEDLKNFEISFLSHPLAGTSQKYLKDCKDGDIVSIGGIIKSVTKRISVKKTTYYKIEVITPLETISITVWKKMYENNKELLVEGNIFIFKGTKGFGGLTLIEFEPDKNVRYNIKAHND